ncbi:MAG TPA: hypothetical protein PLK30_17280 [Blastocatellia bacterium]|nr:hypothetical protein [Blastocatellia bacterium]
MFKLVSAKFLAILLTAFSCLAFASGPVRAENASSESQNEIAENFELKGFCHSPLFTRKLQHKKHQFPVSIKGALGKCQTLPLIDSSLTFSFFWQTSPPILRGPPFWRQS